MALASFEKGICSDPLHVVVMALNLFIVYANLRFFVLLGGRSLMPRTGVSKARRDVVKDLPSNFPLF